MTQSSLSDDLAYVRQLAEEGATTPSLGGRFALMWGTLAILALVAHWSITSGLLNVGGQWIGAAWLVMGITGGMGSLLLSRALRDKPGQSAAGNRAEAAGWPIVTIGLFAFAASVAVAVFPRDAPIVLFDLIIAVAFFAYAVMASMSATLFHEKSPLLKLGVAFGVMAIAVIFVGQPWIYLVAAAGVLITQVLPAIQQVRHEPSMTV